VFLRELQLFMDDEMVRTDPVDKRQRYVIHSAVFSKVSLTDWDKTARHDLLLRVPALSKAPDKLPTCL